MEVDETGKSETQKPDRQEEPEEEEEEDRPATAMSIFSNDSDDDPTWAPAPDLLKKVEKPKILRKKSNNSPLKSLDKIEKLFEKKAAKALKKQLKEKKLEKKVKGKRGRKKKSSKSESSKNGTVLSSSTDVNKEGNAESEMSVDKTSSNVVKQTKTEDPNDFHFLCTLCKLFTKELLSFKSFIL